MGRVTNIYSAHWNGSAGWGTFKQLRGQTVVSQKSLGPTNERTLIQQGNEASMAYLVGVGRDIMTGIDRGFTELKVKNKPNKCKNTEWGAFIGQNRKYSNGVFDYTVPNAPVFIPDNFIAGDGSIAPTPMTTATGDVSDQGITLTWPGTATGAGQNIYDYLQVVIHNQTSDVWGAYILGDYAAARADGTTSLVVAVPFIITDVVRVYTYFQGNTTGAAIAALTGKGSRSTSMLATLSA